MLTAAQFAHAAQLLATIAAGPGAADRQMDLHFRANPGLGARDRGAIAETLYACLRRFGLPRHLVGETGPAEAWLTPSRSRWTASQASAGPASPTK
jgi:hypothetical protein